MRVIAERNLAVPVFVAFLVCTGVVVNYAQRAFVGGSATLRAAELPETSLRGASLARAGSGPPAATSRGSRETPFYEHWRSFTTKDGLPSNETKCVRADGDRVWVGTAEGLACYEHGKWRTYGVKDGLPHRVVLCLDVQPETGDLWVATAGGAARLSAGKFEPFTQLNSGLVNDLVYGVSCMWPNVWFATASGVSRYNVQTREWSIFNQNNTVMFEPWCYAVSAHEGMVYVGVWGGGVVEYNEKTRY
jgi:hypothetical protein